MSAVRELGTPELIDFYRQMLLIRRFEEQASEQYMRGKIRGFLHLYIGEEAIAVGALATLSTHDYVITHYRDHGHALARGLEPKAVMAELFGRSTGTSGGKGGSMHIIDASLNFMGGYAIVGGQLPLAVGLAFSAQYKGESSVTMCFLGDGALNEGEFHEAMNMAAIWNLPVIFFCENNLYGMGSPVADVFAVKEIYKVAEPYGIPSRQMDGMDVLAVREVTQQAVDHVRNGGGPYFLEALTYRFRGHSLADPSEYRHKAEEEYWKKRDPIPAFRKQMLTEYNVSESELDVVDQLVEVVVNEAVKYADTSPEPLLEALHKDIIG